ncbi:MAG: ParA family protein [Burkholderiales bacterium]|nr:ParA family protein [Phycisphaerae bacterium]
MRVLAFMNQKGGVGKTTTTVNLGAALAQHGKNVCLIDIDPQAHLTINYGLEPSADHLSLYDVLVDETPFMDAVHKVGERLAVVPSHIDLAAAEIELVSVLGRELVMRKRIEAATHDFDYILLDCPPSLGLLTINALAAADDVIIPMQPHFLALQGMAKLLETVQLVNKRMNPKLGVGGIVLTMFDSQAKLSHEVIHELESFIDQSRGKNLPWSSARVYDTRIRRNIKLAESPSFGKPIFGYDPTSNGATDYRNLAAEMIAHYEGPAVEETPKLEVTLNPNLSDRVTPGATQGATPRAVPIEPMATAS